MYHVNYEKESGRILGIYDDSSTDRIPAPTIIISPNTREEVLKAPMCYKVKDGMIQQVIEPSKPIPKRAPRKRIENFEFESRMYAVDNYLVENISLNLSIASHDDTHKTKLWCVVDGEWVQVIHNKEQLLGLAKAFDLKRINESE